MKFHIIGHLALASRYVTALNILEASGFNLNKKIFADAGPAASTYYQAENAQEDRALRLKYSDSFFLEKQKAEAGGGYR